MSRAEHVARQRAFYDAGDHDHLRADAAERYAAHGAAALARQAGLRPTDRVLEVGAGFGRFTFALLAHCASVTAVDVSPRMLAELERTRAARGVDPARCRTWCADVDGLDAAALGGPVDAVVGFFVLHHLADWARTVARLAPYVAPGGAVAFVEPNRRNPLYLAQILCCPDMQWREELGLYRITPRRLGAALAAAGLDEVRTSTFGFFPPQVIARSDAAARLERRLERSRLLAPVLPFILASGRTPAG